MKLQEILKILRLYNLVLLIFKYFCAPIAGWLDLTGIFGEGGGLWTNASLYRTLYKDNPFYTISNHEFPHMKMNVCLVVETVKSLITWM